MKKISFLSIHYPKTAIAIMFLITLVLGSQMVKIHIDTDPENMLDKTQPDRAYYNQVKEEFGINDLLVVGIEDGKGIFRFETLSAISRMVDRIIRIKGVITEDVISFTTTNDITSQGGIMNIKPILQDVPQDAEALEAIKRSVIENPFFVEKISSKNGNAAAVYIPIEEKKLSRVISEKIEEIAKQEFNDGQKVYIAGLPIAEDVFGYEMFKQMAYTAPATGMAIMILLFLIFRKLSLIFSPMLVAMFSVVWTMGALIGSGHTVHIMSSMIPVFLMPIAVLDSVHILSEFYDKYPQFKQRKQTLLATIDELHTPMMYTSITTAVGFASLALTDIPPVRIFGLFVAFGAMAAWLLTITLVPAFIMVLPERVISRGLSHDGEKSLLSRMLSSTGNFVFKRHRIFIAAGFAVLLVGIAGITQIVVNDNPVKWFKKGHKIRIADDFMNRNFGGTYMAYLTVRGDKEDTLKRPDVMKYIDSIQAYLEKEEVVGKTSSAADIIKRINEVLHDNDPKFYVVPDSQEEIGQYYFLFLSSGDPDDLDNFVDYEYKKGNIWLQMKSGSNKDMESVISSVERYVATHPLPEGISFKWSGLTYINKVWQDLMVVGMLKAVIGGVIVVFLLMAYMFRSLKLAFISVMPITFAITLAYGLVGIFGKEYDMPIAVCSTMTLGLSIDFAIHFIQRYRNKFRQLKDMEKTNSYVFGGPARAIFRNAVVIIFGFLPMALSTLSPYITVGFFFALLMLITALTTFLLLPALIKSAGPAVL